MTKNSHIYWAAHNRGPKKNLGTRHSERMTADMTRVFLVKIVVRYDWVAD
jgi:hypothetical protein